MSFSGLSICGHDMYQLSSWVIWLRSFFFWLMGMWLKAKFSCVSNYKYFKLKDSFFCIIYIYTKYKITLKFSIQSLSWIFFYKFSWFVETTFFIFYFLNSIYSWGVGILVGNTMSARVISWTANFFTVLLVNTF